MKHLETPENAAGKCPKQGEQTDSSSSVLNEMVTQKLRQQSEDGDMSSCVHVFMSHSCLSLCCGLSDAESAAGGSASCAAADPGPPLDGSYLLFNFHTQNSFSQKNCDVDKKKNVSLKDVLEYKSSSTSTSRFSA